MRPWVISHNAGLEGGLAGSIESFTDTLESGCEAVEFDVRRRADGALVVQHDPLADGDDPPLLETVLELLSRRLVCNFELKEDGYVEEVLAVAERHLPPELILVSSAIDGAVRAASPRATTGVVVGRKRDPIPSFEEVAARVRDTGATYVCTHHQLLAHGVLDWAGALGTPPLVWTVNDDGMLRELLSDERVAGVFTDYPRRAVALRGTGR